MSHLKKRNQLPNFIRLPYIFDIAKILKALDRAGEDFDALNDKEGYGKVAESCPSLEEVFGLRFANIESAKNYLRKNSVQPGGRDFIRTSKQAVKLKNNPYKQMDLTEYNPQFNPDEFKAKIPKNRLDERQYNQLKPWVKNTYLEEVLSTFQGFVTRARLARMEPGCVIDEHIDYNTDYSIRVHIPLKTNERCGLYVRRSASGKKDCLKMPADGHCWFINQGWRHSAWNKGNTPRDHLVLSIAGQEDLPAEGEFRESSG